MPDVRELRLPTIHACPPRGSGLMPCCGRTPFDVPESDRMTVDGLVTCGYTQTACLDGHSVVITLTAPASPTGETP